MYVIVLMVSVDLKKHLIVLADLKKHLIDLGDLKKYLIRRLQVLIEIDHEIFSMVKSLLLIQEEQ